MFLSGMSKDRMFWSRMWKSAAGERLLVICASSYWRVCSISGFVSLFHSINTLSLIKASIHMLLSLVNMCSGHYQKYRYLRVREGWVIPLVSQVGTMVSGKLFQKEVAILHCTVLLWGVKLLDEDRRGHSIIRSNMSDMGRIWLPGRYWA